MKDRLRYFYYDFCNSLPGQVLPFFAVGGISILVTLALTATKEKNHFDIINKENAGKWFCVHWWNDRTAESTEVAPGSKCGGGK